MIPNHSYIDKSFLSEAIKTYDESKKGVFRSIYGDHPVISQLKDILQLYKDKAFLPDEKIYTAFLKSKMTRGHNSHEAIKKLLEKVKDYYDREENKNREENKSNVMQPKRTAEAILWLHNRSFISEDALLAIIETRKNNKDPAYLAACINLMQLVGLNSKKNIEKLFPLDVYTQFDMVNAMNTLVQHKLLTQDNFDNLLNCPSLPQLNEFLDKYEPDDESKEGKENMDKNKLSQKTLTVTFNKIIENPVDTLIDEEEKGF